MFGWFERRLDPYPTSAPEQPPKGLVAFCVHYSKGAKRWLIAMAGCSALIALIEILLFSFIGNIVDWLSNADRATFLETDGPRLMALSDALLDAQMRQIRARLADPGSST